MLDEHDSEAEFVELREHYEHLLSSFKAIEKAREQVVLLTPIIENGVLFKEQQEKLKELTEVESCLSPYFAEKRKTLFEEAAKSLETDILKKANQITAIRNDLEQLNNQKTDLQIAISTNKVYEQIQNLDKAIQQAEREQKQREERAKRYNALAEKLELNINPNEAVFYRRLEKSRQEIEKTAEALDNLQQQQVGVQVAQTEEINKLKILEERLNSLQNRRNRIPIEQIRIREDLLTKLNISEKEMPFAAELMKVKDDEKSWETVFEKRFGLKYELPQIRIRSLSGNLANFPISDVTLSLNDWNTINLTTEIVFIITDKLNFLRFPETANAIAIFATAKIIDNLKQIVFLKNKTIYFWGDISIQGITDLSTIRKAFPKVQSFLMTVELLEKYNNFVITKKVETNAIVTHLTVEEQAVLKAILEGKSLMQEVILQEDVKECLDDIL